MRPHFNLYLLGHLLGNTLFQYMFARGYCERFGFELHTDPWIGEKIFQNVSHPRPERELPRRAESTLNMKVGEGEVSYYSYSQCQNCAEFYSMRKVREWLQFRPEVTEALATFVPEDGRVVAHVRRGDFAGYGYPLVSKASYIIQARRLGAKLEDVVFVSDEHPMLHHSFDGVLAGVPDFYRLANASILLRANSTFSFWAGVIAEADHRAMVFSPVVASLLGGVEHDVPFVEGNHARLSAFDFVTSITIPP
jgi:hypothetical protein